MDSYQHAYTNAYMQTETLSVMNNLAVVLMNDGLFDESGRLFSQSHELCREALGPLDKSTVISLYNVGYNHKMRGGWVAVEMMCRLMYVCMYVSSPCHDFSSPRTQRYITTIFTIIMRVIIFDDDADDDDRPDPSLSLLFLSCRGRGPGPHIL